MARPKEFDREAALDKAMRLFWRQGYAASSTEDLLSAMNIGRQSLYDTFGDKRSLYLEALRRYHAGAGQVADETTSAPSALEAIRNRLLQPVDRSAEVRAMGCMGINATVGFCGSEPVVERLAADTAGREEGVFARIVEQGIADGEFPPRTDAAAAGRFLYMALQGLTVRGQAGMTPEALHEAVDFTIKALITG